MSSARALANHKLYLARILAEAWSEALQREQVTATTLAQAFQVPAVNHLVDAYGWFLLEVSGAESLPAAPPRGCQALPPIAQGKAVPGEIREFLQLESDGWLQALLADYSNITPITRQQTNSLAVSAAAALNPGQIREWAQALEDLFDRMADSLDEY